MGCFQSVTSNFAAEDDKKVESGKLKCFLCFLSFLSKREIRPHTTSHRASWIMSRELPEYLDASSLNNNNNNNDHVVENPLLYRSNQQQQQQQEPSSRVLLPGSVNHHQLSPLHSNSNPEPLSSANPSPLHPTTSTSTSRRTMSSSSGDPDYDNQLSRLRRFYQQYDPTRVPHAEITLRTWKGSYTVMWTKLTAKYGPEPEETEMQQVAGGTGGLSALAAATMAAQKLSPHRNRGVLSGDSIPQQYAGRSDINYRARLQRFYAKYAPHRLPTVDKALEIFRGKEESLFESLRRKFGPEPDENFPIPEVADMISSMDEPTASLQILARGGDDSNNGNNSNNAPYPTASSYINNTTTNINSAAATSAATREINQMDSSSDTDAQPTMARGKPVNLSQFQASLDDDNNPFPNVTDNNNNASSPDQQQPESDPIDWESMCSCCSECTDSLGECLQNKSMERFFKWFYPICFICAIIGAIVTALILVGVDRNLVVFKQKKSTSELDLTQLYPSGLYTWGVNVRGIEFPTTLKEVKIFKDVVCCGGQNINLGKTFFWTIRDETAGGEVNLTELADMIVTFGGLPEDKIVVQAREAFSDAIASWSQNMSLDEFVSNRTAIEDAAHAGLVRELRRNKIFVDIPRRYFTLGHIVVPVSYTNQKIRVFQNAQEIITAGFREQASIYRLTTTQQIRDIEANTTLIRNEASTNATRLRNIATSTSAALSLQNIAEAVARMSTRVNAVTEAAAINLLRLNELLDIIADNSDTQFFVSLRNGNVAFPLI